jgi:hypothetical protein
MIAQKGGFEEAYSFIDNQLNNVELPRSLVGGKRIKLYPDAIFAYRVPECCHCGAGVT